MDFSKIKEKALQAKKALAEKADKAVSFSRDKIISSALIKDNTVLDEFIAKTSNYTSSTWNIVEKVWVLLVVDITSDFYKKLLYVFPTLYTKGWSKNIEVKMLTSDANDVDRKKYNIDAIPSLVLFKDKKVSKLVDSEEKILKIVRTPSLDLEKTLQEI